VAIAADDNERIDVISRERHFQGVQRQVDVCAVLVAARSQIALDHLDSMLRHAAAVVSSAFPVAVCDFCNDFGALLDRFKNRSDIKVPVQRALDADFDVVEVDEYRDFQTISVQKDWSPYLDLTVQLSRFSSNGSVLLRLRRRELHNADFIDAAAG